MYDKVINPTVEFYDSETNEYIGKASFDLPPESENALLKLICHGEIPSKLLINNLKLYDLAEGYTSLTPYQKYERTGILRATFYDAHIQEATPMEIRFKYNILVRSLLYGNQYRSAELSDIEIASILPIT